MKVSGLIARNWAAARSWRPGRAAANASVGAAARSTANCRCIAGLNGSIGLPQRIGQPHLQPEVLRTHLQQMAASGPAAPVRRRRQTLARPLRTSRQQSLGQPLGVSLRGGDPRPSIRCCFERPRPPFAIGGPERGRRHRGGRIAPAAEAIARLPVRPAVESGCAIVQSPTRQSLAAPR